MWNWNFKERQYLDKLPGLFLKDEGANVLAKPINQLCKFLASLGTF